MSETVIKGWSIRCSSHTYVTLLYDGKFVICLDNDVQYMEDIIKYVEKRTQLKFTDIPILGCIEDFDGLRFLNGGFKRGYEWLNKSQENQYIPEKEKAAEDLHSISGQTKNITLSL